MKSILAMIVAAMAAWGQSVHSGTWTSNGLGSASGAAIAQGGDNSYCGPGDVANFGGTSDGPANLPSACVYTAMSGTPSPGATLTAADSADFTTKLAAAACGDTIILTAGATYTGKFTLPNKACDATHWITIRSSATSDPNFPAEGVRATPCEINLASVSEYPTYSCAVPGVRMPTIQTNTVNTPAVDVAAGADHYRFIGINFSKAAGSSQVQNKLIQLSNSADHIVLDRVLCHGVPYNFNLNDQLQGCLGTNSSTYIAVIDSWLYDINFQSSDANAISGGTSSNNEGPIKIVNNLIAADGESWIFGGGGATTTPHDLEIRRNHSFKPLTWMLPIGGSGNHPLIKNNGECKNCLRVLLEANEVENNWQGWQGDQSAYGFLLTPKNQQVFISPTVTVSGTAVTITSGGPATADMVGHYYISGGINGSPKIAITDFIDANHVTLASAPGDGTGLAAAMCHPGQCPNCIVKHITARYNHIRNTGRGIQMATVVTKCGDEASGMSNVSAHDNIIEGLDNRLTNANSSSLGPVMAFDINSTAPNTPQSDMHIVHNTVAVANAGADGFSGLANELANLPTYLANIIYRDNLSPAGIITTHLSGTVYSGGTLPGLNEHDCPNHDGLNCTYTLTKNVLGTGQWFHQNTGCSPYTACPTGYPTSNVSCGIGGETCFPDGAAFTGQFVNYNNGYLGDYHLALTSPYHNAGTDGKDIGADINAVIAKTSGVRAATTYPALSVTTAALPNGTVGAAYSQTLAASSGASPFKMWTLLSGALPAGLNTLDTDGTLSGTPTAAGMFAFTVQVQDGGRQTATKALSITVQ